MIEKWKPIREFEEFYSVSCRGRVKSHLRGIKNPKTHTGGYYHVPLWKNKKWHYRYIHRLVLEHFSGESKLEHTRHLNGIKTDNRIENLKWGTALENTQDKRDHGTINKGSRNGAAKLSEQQVTEIKELLKTRMMQKDIAKLFNIHAMMISNIKLNKNWKHV